MGKSKSDKDLHAEARDLVDELPDETAAGRIVRDNGAPASADEWLRNRSRAMKMKDQQNQPAQPNPMSVPSKKNDNESPNR
jgi:hypothetical protein